MTLVRSISINNGIVLAVVLVVGTSVIVVICSIMLYVLRSTGLEEDEVEDDDEDEQDEKLPEDPEKEEIDADLSDSETSDEIDNKYNLSNFE